MAVQTRIDITTDLNNNDICQLDVGGYDYAEVQLITPTGTFSFLTSNDAGDITGISDGNPTSATNFTAVSGTKLSDNSTVTSLAASGVVKFSNLGQFLKITGAGGAQVTKGIVRLYKIH